MRLPDGMRCFRDPEALVSWEPLWREVLGGQSEPYLDPFWFQAWWQAFGKGAELFFLVMERPVRAFIPLMCRDRVLSFVGNEYSHRHGIATDGAMSVVWECLLPVLESRRSWKRVRLSNLRVDSKELLGFQGGSGWREVRGESELWALPACDESWEEYLGQRGLESRRKRKKVARRLAEFGGATIDCAVSPLEAKAFCQAYFQILSGSWKSPEKSRDFFRKLCVGMAERGRFRSYLLRIDGEPVAAQLGFLSGDTYFCYKTAYLEKFSVLSPGISVMDLAFEDATRQGAKRVDLLTGAAGYKRIWCNESVRQVHLLWGRWDDLSVLSPPVRKAVVSVDLPVKVLRCEYSDLMEVLPYEGELREASAGDRLGLAVAMGLPNLNAVDEFLNHPARVGWIGCVGGRIVDYVWMERGERVVRVVACAAEDRHTDRERRRSFLSGVFRKFGEREEVFWVECPGAGVGSFEALGFGGLEEDTKKPR